MSVADRNVFYYIKTGIIIKEIRCIAEAGHEIHTLF